MNGKEEDFITQASQRLIKETHVKSALEADKGSNAQLISWKVEDFTIKGDNYACVVTSIKVTYRQGGSEHKATYVAKCNPCRQHATLDEFVHMAFEKEAGFYQDLLPLLNTELIRIKHEPLRVAQCHFVHLVKGEEVIILGDLRLEAFKMFSRQKGMDKAHSILVLKELATLHAASLLVKAKTPEDLDVRYKYLQKDLSSLTDNENDKPTMFQKFALMSARMIEKIGGYNNVVEWLKDFGPKANDVFKEQVKKTPPFDVLCHGDCWNNNILFRYDKAGVPVDVRLLDFQLCRKSSPATDLNYFTYTSLEGPNRKDNLQTFLKTYHDSFTKVLQNAGAPVPFTLEELRQEYHNKNLFGLLIGIMILPLVVSESSEALDLSKAKGQKFLEEHLERMTNQLHNPVSRSRFLSMFEDMIEYGIIS
ncbi:uncharacterized protein LOC121867237 [Homarus americanus]|uniref:uncharacterized protein LOC121867237 n=1 Tax=Homarus americanus TaxID=6706 RepID=UPI001C43855A|nr:uncharacterized protein LOC121867237 [Homarus americanus]